MDFQTFVLAMSDIANTIYSKSLDDVDENVIRGEAQAALTLINYNLMPLDDHIQSTEKGNYSQA